MLRFLDGFDDLSTGTLGQRYQNELGSVEGNPLGGSWLRLNDGVDQIHKFPFQSSEDVIVGALIRPDPYSKGPAGDNPLIGIGNYTDNWHVNVLVGYRSDGSICVWSPWWKFSFSTPAQLRAVAACGLRLYGYQYLEFRAFCDSVSGSIEIRLNGETILKKTGLDLVNDSGAAGWDFLYIVGRGGTNGKHYFDNIYVCDGSGSVANDFLGPILIETLLPSGSGFYSGWSPSPTAANFENVDEVPPDNDATYVQTTTVGTRDSYAYSDLLTTGCMLGMVLWASGSGTSASVRGLSRLGGSDLLYEVMEINGAFKYGYTPIQRDERPGGGVWTVNDVNNAEFGIEFVG